MSRGMPCTKIKVSLPIDIVLALDTALYDPTFQKPRYGARSQLVAHLLRGWLEEHRPEISLDSEPDDILQELERKAPKG